MSRIRIDHATLVLPDRLVHDQSIFIRDGKIEQVGPAGPMAPPVDHCFDLGGDYLAPGFIDLHIHGSGPFLINNGPEELAGLSALLPRYGVTSFLPTVTPSTKGQEGELLSALAATRTSGAQIAGFHLEGPFLALSGSLPLKEAEALPGDRERVERFIRGCDPYPAVFSISPEFPGVLDLIPAMIRSGAPVFMTHTAASVEQTRKAIDAGVRHATHFYDVFPSPPEKEPGVRPCGAVEAILADPGVTVDFILDGEHVHPVACQMALVSKGAGGVCLITDANVGAGLPPGPAYRFSGYEVTFAYEGAPARITADGPSPGVLAGSGLTMDAALRNAVRLLALDLPQAVSLVSANPARVMGIADRKGQIAPGYDADLVQLTSRLSVRQTWIAGQAQLTGRSSQPSDSGGA